MNSSDASPCPECGTPRPPHALAGHCPACLLRIGLAVARGGMALAVDSAGAFDPESPDPAGLGLCGNGRIGDYELLEAIAQGGMGVVYRARQLSLNRVVALKMIRAGELADEAEVARFRIEAEAAAHLDHPHIVPIHEIGEHQGRHYFSMKWVGGGTLADRCRARPKRAGPSPQAREDVVLLEKVSRAVQHAHQRGVLHRDLKPGNILIDAAGEPQVSDFGLARRMETDSAVTVSGAMLGTPSYAAPEQISGVQMPTTAVDVYGLGAILYVLLTGQPPFQGATAVETLVLVRQGQLVAPRAQVAGVDRDLETICLKCLEKEPGHRYPSAEALADELRRWLEGKPILARPVSPPERLWLWVRRHQVVSGFAAVTVAALLATAGVSTTAAIRLRRERDLTRAAQREATTELWQSLIAQARATRVGGQAGVRAETLKTITAAARIRPSVEVRNEAVAALSLTDMAGEPEPRLVVGLRGFPAFDATLERFAVQDADGDVVVGETASGRINRRLDAKGRGIRSLAWSPDTLHLAVYDAADEVTVWSMKDGTPRWRTGVPHEHDATAFAFHPTQPVLVLRTGARRLRWVDLETGDTRAAVELPWEPLRFVLSPDGSRIAFDRDDRCEVWDVQRGTSLGTLTNQVCLGPIAWHPDGRQIAVGDCDGGIVVWDVDAGTRAVWTRERQLTATVAFNPTGTLLVSGHDNHRSQLWDVASGQRLGLRRDGVAQRFDASGRRIAYWTASGRFGHWTVAGPVHQRHLGFPPGISGSLDTGFSPDGRWMVTLHADAVRLWDVESARLLAVGATQHEERNVVFALDGRSLLTRADNEFWQCSIGSEGSNGPPVIGPPRKIREVGIRSLNQALVPSQFGRLFPVDLLRHFNSDTVRWVDREHPSDVYELAGFPAGVLSLSRTTNWLATYGPQGLQIQRMAGGTIPIPTEHPGGQILMSPDNRGVVHAGAGILEMFDPATGRRRWKRPQETAATVFMTFSHDGRLLALGGTGSEHVWLIDPATGAELTRLTPQGEARIEGLAFSPDDQRLAVVHERDMVLWNLPSLRRQLAELGLDWSEKSP
jgi:WD40 repeat protein/tRNA A-37 threonylcarbamoyl transferase component Bud32